MNASSLFVNPSDPYSLPLSYARFSLPLERGRYAQKPALVISNGEGNTIPIQSEVLVNWPDGSVRMVHLTFPARGGQYTVATGAKEIPTPQNALRVWAEGGTIKVENGALRAQLGGLALIQALELNGQKYCDGAGLDIEVADEQGQVFRARQYSDGETRIETAGPLRAAARGAMWSQPPRRGVFETHSLALDCLAYAHEISGDKKDVEAELRSLEILLASQAFQTPVPEGKPFAMLYRTWINFSQAANSAGVLALWEYKY